ncbi:5-formyltetrahydrofolate cyclo-ligase [Demequina oxidasica]|uniref:5-formyltetrahydrofolate cyclo-ligase n=1 Tax=Demequina oxidasica TaxID=676199 RepID=UPI000785F35E|nr:5-formyltetrahydrofolate cyclo-ligase [Demequina oxidasica]
MTQQSMTPQRAVEPADSKALLRSSIRKGRADRSERRLKEHAEALRDHVLALPSVGKAKCVSVYASRKFEPGTLPLIEALHQRGVKVLIPMLGDGLKRGWGVYQGADDLIERAPGRPPEPSGEFLGQEALHEAEVVVVPALAVDATGNRLGQGGGWYDRALCDAAPNAPIVALTFAGELRDEAHALPHEEHDIMVHAVITPQGVTRLPA